MLQKLGRVVALLMVVMLVAAILTACGDSGSTPASTAAATTTTAATTAATTTTSATTTTASNATTTAATTTTSATTTTASNATTTAGSASATTASAASTAASVAAGAACSAPVPAASNTKLTIGIALQVSIPPLVLTQQGFIQGMASCGFVQGQNVTYDLKDGQNDIPSLQLIGQRFHDENVDMIFAIGTNALIQMYNTNKDTGKPLVFAAITDPYAALSSVVKSPTDHAQVTGSQAYPPVDQGLKLIQTAFPKAKKIGIVSNSNEANSKIVVQAVQQAASTYGYTIDVKTITKAGDVLSASQALASDKVDVFLAQTDTTVSNAFESMVQVSLQNNIPIIALDAGYGSRGAVVSLGVDYKSSGMDAAKIGAQIASGTKASDTTITKLQSVNVAINTAAASKLGVTLPDSVTKGATVYNAIVAPTPAK